MDATKDKIIESIVESRQNGESPEIICRKLNISKTTYYRYIKQGGVQIHPMNRFPVKALNSIDEYKGGCAINHDVKSDVEQPIKILGGNKQINISQKNKIDMDILDQQFLQGVNNICNNYKRL